MFYRSVPPANTNLAIVPVAYVSFYPLEILVQVFIYDFILILIIDN